MQPRLVLYLLLVFVIEYGLKALFENLAANGTGARSARLYTAYRITTLVAYTGILWSLSPLRLGPALITGTLLTVVASTEILASFLSGWAYLRTQRICRPLHIVAHGLFSATVLYLGVTLPWPSDLPHSIEWLHRHTFPIYDLSVMLYVALIYFLASIPGNYVIRWLMNKEEDASLPELAIGDLLLTLPLASPRTAASWPISSATAETPKQQTFRAGRVIGVLERWMLLALMARGELAAVGFVFTAKSIVRYREFDKQEFAEYYLVGTLYSILVALALSTFL